MADKYQELAEAVMRLQAVIKNLGPDAALTGIVLSGGMSAAYQFTTAMRSSPSFQDYGYVHTAHCSPQIRQLMGVRIRILDDLGQEIY